MGPMSTLHFVRRIALIGTASASALLALGCNSGTWQSDSQSATAAKAADAAALESSADATIATFRSIDPTFDTFMSQAYGWVVFPSVGKGGFIVGGGGGKGVVYRGGAKVGTATMSFGTIGAQIGGQTFSEIIFFQTQAAFEKFCADNLEFAANASAVAATAGAAATANYSNGIAVFVKPDAGLMLDASIGGQKFDYTPN